MDASKALPVVALEINFFKFNQVFKLWRCAQNVPNGMKPTITERHRTQRHFIASHCKHTETRYLVSAGVGLKIRRPERVVGVQVPLPAPYLALSPHFQHLFVSF